MSVEHFRHENMIPGPAAEVATHNIWETEDGVLMAYGLSAVSVLEATSTVYAPGCIYIKSLTAGTSIVYVNVGTMASPDFESIDTTA